MVAQREYKRRRECFGKKIHKELCRKCRLAVIKRWYGHQLDTVTEKDMCKVLWDFNTHTDHAIQGKKLDVILIDKEKKECKIIHFAIPYESRLGNGKKIEK